MRTTRKNSPYPTLAELPAPPTQKIGWPWSEERPSLEAHAPDSRTWPKISVITPSYNQGQFLEETIRSVLLQGYPNLEYILIDGGSTDTSIQILQRYAPYLAYWASERDRGQAHAINKGFALSSGDILCWLNSDDLLQPGALLSVAEQLSEPVRPAWLVGATAIISADSRQTAIRSVTSITRETLLDWPETWFPQQSTFWTRALWKHAGPLDEALHYVMDLNLWLRMFDVVKPRVTEKLLSAYRYQEEAKCIAHPECVAPEVDLILRAYFMSLKKGHLKQLRRELHAPGTRKRIGERLLSWVHEAYAAGQYDEARQYLFCALRLDPALWHNAAARVLQLKLLVGNRPLHLLRSLKHAHKE